MTFDEFLETLIQKKSSDIRVGYICKIESVDYKKLTASISPLWKFAGEDGNKKYGVLTDVPISFLGGNSVFARATLEKGDLVLCLFVSHSLDSARKGNASSDEYKSHGLQNVIILGTVFSSLALPTKKGFLVSSKLGDIYLNITDSQIDCKVKDTLMVLKSSGVEITGDVIIKGNLEVDKEITWMKKTKPGKASKHIHPTPTGPSGVYV